ncbi:MAG: glutamine--fructose-6-phosphate transaminase (isomerizing) [Gammaproteobacteria bacterium]|nr:glutamine--fructose-6-phosphate transaminase (isomerizing) [Gammaproteobacteria bacterium]MXX94299.1 glutamine--fructose-6-phosphate transaminase (isomerizing) [Gammaproteobacteria bacterium]MYF52874.1 glutamine--fructose-6-phosphate transaminase (isomerizing) [Gammaproteobacteria bacterium]MYK42557.1 glutamine--fructose-6-phosphate transaminase (isomerizing) [Gammaproteobacteria bacterium]
MCGIVGATSVRPVSAILLEGLRRLEYRGYDSAGLVTQEANTGAFSRLRVSGKVRELEDKVQAHPLAGSVGLAHTRWATHGIPSESNAHPLLVNDEIALVHNGIIENFSALRTELIELGCRFSTDTDSEVILQLIYSQVQAGTEFLPALWETFSRLEGAYAIGLMVKNQPGKIFAIRKDCPLVIGIGISENYIASDVLALRPFTDKFVFLDEGELAILDQKSVSITNELGEKLLRKPEIVKHQGDSVDKGGFRHFLEKEIYDQPQSIRNTLEGRVSATRVIEQSFGLHALNALRAAQSITIVGCGTSYYAACVARYWIEDMVEIPCQAEIASEFRYRRAAVPENSLFITLSQSGESADTLAAHRLAKTMGFLYTLNIGNVTTSSLMREADTAIAMRAGLEVSVASTKSFTTMLVDLLLLALVLARFKGCSNHAEGEIVRALRSLDSTIAKTLNLTERTRELAEEFLDKQNALFLGRGIHYPIALEGALKLKEISYMHAEGYPAGELKHGPLALVDAEMPVVVVAPNNELLRKTQSNLQEVRARGGKLYVFTDQKDDFPHDDNVTIIEVPPVHSLLSPIVYTVPLQLLAYHVASLKGTDIDQPRNIAKSVTVE